MHFHNIDDSSEREMASPFATAAAQAAKPSSSSEASIQGVGSSPRRHQGFRHPNSSSNNYYQHYETPVETSGAAPPPPENGLLATASSLSHLSPFAHAPPLAPSLSASLVDSQASTAIQSGQSDQRSQKSSPIGQSIASATPINETADDAVAAAMHAVTSPMGVPEFAPNAQFQQRNLPMTPPSPFLHGAAPDDLYQRHPLPFNLFPVQEGIKEGQSSSTDISTPHFPRKLHQEKQQELLQHLFPPSGSAGGGTAGTAGDWGDSSTPRNASIGRVGPQLRTHTSSPVVYTHPSGIPRLGSSSNNSVLSSPPSPAAAAAAATAAGGSAFANLGGNTTSPNPFSFGGMQLSPEQLQKAALQALQSGQSYASTLGAGAGARGAGVQLQPQTEQQASAADKLMAYQLMQHMQQLQLQQQQLPAVPAGVVIQPPPPPPLYLQDAALQALQKQPSSTPTSIYSPLRRSESWSQFGAHTTRGGSPPSGKGSPLERSPAAAPAASNDAVQMLFPAARYSISRDSGGDTARNQRLAPAIGTSAAESAEQRAASLLHRVQQSTKHFPKVRALLNTGGRFTTDSDTGSLQYEGGEVRLVSLPDGCTFPQLLAVLAKTERPGLSSLSPSAATSSATATASKASPRGVMSNASKETSATTTVTATPTAAQTLSAAATAVSVLVSAQEAAAGATEEHASSALDAESYATYAMHVARAHCLLRYQLPSDPSIFVDVVDDEDVQLMFEEIAELRAFGGLFGNAGRSSGGGAAPKLRLFVQWIAPPPGSNLAATLGGVGAGGVGGGLQLNNSSRNNTLDYIEGEDQFINPMYSGSLSGLDNRTISSGGEEGSAGDVTGSGVVAGGSGSGAAATAVTTEKYYSAGENSTCSSLIAPRNNETTTSTSPQGTHSNYHSQNQQNVHTAHRSASELRLAAVRSDQLECIPACEVTLVELLGTGTFGDMYVGKWRECTVAVKCLNPSAVGLNYRSQAAWLAFLHDANSAAALRHPSLVEVYGIVLPGAQDQRAMELEVQQRSESLDLALKAAGGLLGNVDGQGGLMIDPKMSGRRTSWDFGALHSTNRCSSTPIPSPSTQTGGSTSAAAAAAATAVAMSSSPFCAGMQRLPGPCMSTPAMVMEYVSGRSLHGAIRRKEDAVAGVLARILYALDVARGMAYLHQRGVSHFDLKSTNVLIGWRNMRPAAKIAGYGLSARKTSLQTYTPGITMNAGVFPWTAPEIFRNPEKVSHKADVFSFGIILFELWALQLPYEGLDMNKLVSLAVNTDEEVRPEIPPAGGSTAEPAPGWKELVQQCWAEDPDERPEFVEVEKILKKMAKEVKSAQRKPEGSTKGAAVEKKGGGGGGGGRDDGGAKVDVVLPIENKEGSG